MKRSESWARRRYDCEGRAIARHAGFADAAGYFTTVPSSKRFTD